MDMYIDDHYPADAVYGEDLLSGAHQSEMVVETADGPATRMERVLITSRTIDEYAAGRVCIGERTVRHLAHKFGMIDDWRVDRIKDDNQALRAELIDLSHSLAKVREEARFLRELETQPPVRVYMALDGSEHDSRRGAVEATARSLGVETTLINAAHPVAVDLYPEVTAP